MTDLEKQLKDYQTRCQAWANQSQARDRYVSTLETALLKIAGPCQNGLVENCEYHCPACIARNAVAVFTASPYV